jgi:phospholipid/cholesterol/gamma-HCH transport system substrate-binding protein
MKREVRIGIFFAAALLVLAVFILSVGNMSVLFKKSGYSVTSDFDTAAGLEKRAEVKMAGVQIGYVKDIRLVRRRAQVVMTIYRGIEIPKDAKVTLAAQGLLGEQYVEIMPGTSDAACRPGESLESIPSAGLDQLGPLLVSLKTRVDELGQELRNIMGSETKAGLKSTLDNLSEITSGLKEWISENRQAAGQTVRDASQAFKNMDREMKDVSSSLGQALQTLTDIAAENRDNIKTDIEKVKDLIQKIEESLKLLNQSLEKINRGEGTLGKIIQGPELYDKAQGALDDVRQTVRPLKTMRAIPEIRADYYGKSALLRASLGLSLWLTPERFFSAELIRDPWNDRFAVTALAGRRWGGFAPRAGLIESEFGLGADYYMLNDRWVWSLEGFDFNRDTRPRLRLASRFTPFQYVSFVLGVDDFALAAKREFFFGMGLELR